MACEYLFVLRNRNNQYFQLINHFKILLPPSNNYFAYITLYIPEQTTRTIGTNTGIQDDYKKL